MKAVKQVVAIAVAGVAFMLHASYGVAQQVTGELGSPSATTTAPVSVARSTIRVAPLRAAHVSASARIRRPSASVLPISTVRPLRVGTTSSGRNDVPDTMFSTAAKKP